MRHLFLKIYPLITTELILLGFMPDFSYILYMETGQVLNFSQVV